MSEIQTSGFVVDPNGGWKGGKCVPRDQMTVACCYRQSIKWAAVNCCNDLAASWGRVSTGRCCKFPVRLVDCERNGRLGRSRVPRRKCRHDGKPVDWIAFACCQVFLDAGLSGPALPFTANTCNYANEYFTRITGLV